MNEFIKNESSILVNVPYAEAYLSEGLFSDSNSSVAAFIGDAVSVLGIFNMRFFNSEDEAQNRDKVKLRTFKYSNRIETHPSTISEPVELTINNITDRFYILSYYMGDVMMESAIPKNILNCEAYQDALLKAKFPRNVLYPDLFYNWIKNYKTNNISPDVKAVILQLIISEITRDAKDPSKPYRFAAADAPSVNPNDYIVMNMNNVASNTSVLNGIGFERVKEKLTTGLTMSKKGVKQSISPLEEVIVM